MVKLREEVERFLALFFPKLEIWGIFVLYREKNQEALRLLGITPAIKVALGDPGTHTICISFHKAEYPLQYAFKDEKNG